MAATLKPSKKKAYVSKDEFKKYKKDDDKKDKQMIRRALKRKTRERC